MPHRLLTVAFMLLLTGSCAAPERVGERPEAVSESRFNSVETLIQLAAAADAISDGNAVSALPLLAAVDPGREHGVALFLRGVAYLRLGEYGLGRKALLRALEVDPDDVASLTVLARIHYELGEIDDGVECLQRAVVLDTEDPQIRASLGLLYLEQSRWIDAHELLLSAVELDPDSLEAHRGLAVLFSAVGEPAWAEKAYRQAGELDPDNVSLLVGLGHSLRDSGRPLEAVSPYRRAAELEPLDPIHAANIGSALFEAGRLQAARPEYESALELAEDVGMQTAMIHLSLGRVLEGLGDVEGAVFEYELVLDEDPDLGAAHEALGLIALDLGDRSEALDHLRSALDLSGLSPAGVMHLGLLYDRLGDAEGTAHCVALLESALDTNPEVPFRLAQLHVRCSDPTIRNPSTAIALLNRLVEDRLLEQGAAWNLLAEAHALEGRYDAAIEAMDRALESRQPGDPLWSQYAQRRDRYVAATIEP